MTSVKYINLYKKTALSDDQYAEFSRLIAEAILNESTIRITLYDGYGQEDYSGIPIMQNGRLRLVMNEDVMPIPMDRVVDVQSN